VLAMLRAIAHERQIAVVCSLHQVELALEFADRIIGLRAGQLVANHPVAQLGPAERSHIYQAGIEAALLPEQPELAWIER